MHEGEPMSEPINNPAFSSESLDADGAPIEGNDEVAPSAAAAEAGRETVVTHHAGKFVGTLE